MQTNDSKQLQPRGTFIVPLCLLGALLSLALVHVHTIGDYSLCTFSKTLSCKEVVLSDYSTLLGVPLAQWGLAFYLALLMLALVFRCFPIGQPARCQDALLVIGVAAVLFSAYLAYLSKFKIKAFCPFCVGLYIVNAILLAAAWAAGRGRPAARRFVNGAAALARMPLDVLAGLARPGASRRRVLAGTAALAAAVGLSACAPLTIGALYDWGDRVVPEEKLAVDLRPGMNEDYHLGAADAPVRVVVFSDIECPVCRRLHRKLQELLPTFDNHVLLVFKNYPIDSTCNPSVPDTMHPSACYAALFARCAGEQGQFWPVLDRLFNLPELDQNTPRVMVKKAIWELIGTLKLDEEGMQQCMESDRYVPQIQHDIQVADALGLRGTPLVFINGREVGLASIENIERIIRRDLARAGVAGQ